MKTKQRLPWLMMMFIGLFPLLGVAQSYDQLWKEVEMYQKKDLPKSVIAREDLCKSEGRTQPASADEGALGAGFPAGFAYAR